MRRGGGNKKKLKNSLLNKAPKLYLYVFIFRSRFFFLTEK